MHGSWIADNNVATSSRLLKTAIEDLPMRAATASLRPVTFRYKRGPEAKHIRFGFVAEEVAAAVPELVRTLPGGTLGIVMSDIVAIVFAKVQRVEQTLTVLLSMEERQEGRVRAAENEARTLRRELEALRKENEVERLRLARIERHLGYS